MEKFEHTIGHVLPLTSPELIKEWQEELYYDLRTGQGIFNESMKEFIAHYKRGLLIVGSDTFLENGFIIPRNFKWMQKWHQYFEALENTLFCVGAAHLFGEYWILNLLFQNGYSITYPFDGPLPMCQLCE